MTKRFDASFKAIKSRAVYLMWLNKRFGCYDFEDWLDRSERVGMGRMYVPLRFSGREVKQTLNLMGFPKLAILGGPGFGRTTLIRQLIFEIAGPDSSWIHEADKDLLPILLFLADYDLGAMGSFDELLAEWWRRVVVGVTEELDKSFDPGLLEEYFKAGKALYLVDGLDDVGDESRDKVLGWLNDLKIEDRQAGIACQVVLTGCFTDSDSPPGFQLLEILPYNGVQAEEFLDKLLKALGMLEKHRPVLKRALSTLDLPIVEPLR